MPPVTVLAKPTAEQTQARLDSEHAAAELEVARLQNVRPSSPAQLAAAKETARLAGLRKKFTVAQHHKRDQRFFSGIHDKLIKMAAEFFRGSRDSSVSSFCFVVVSSSATGRSRTIQKVCLLPNLRANSLKVEKAESFLINLLSDPDSCIIPEFSDLSIIVSRLIAASHASGALEIACAAFKDKGPAETMRLLETSFFTALQVILGAQEASDRPYVSPGEDDVAFAEAVAAAAAVRRKQAEAEAEAAEAAEEAPGAGGEGGVRDGGVGTGDKGAGPADGALASSSDAAGGLTAPTFNARAEAAARPSSAQATNPSLAVHNATAPPPSLDVSSVAAGGEAACGVPPSALPSSAGLAVATPSAAVRDAATPYVWARHQERDEDKVEHEEALVRGARAQERAKNGDGVLVDDTS